MYNLSTPLFDKGHHIYWTIFSTVQFSSLDLLKNRQVHVAHCVKTDSVPVSVRNGNPKGDPPHVVEDDRLTYIIWQDRRQVRVLTTFHNDITYEKTTFIVPPGHCMFLVPHLDHKRTVNHPKAMQHYTQFMGGVDVSDQQICYSMHRCLKW